ncbi:MAG TPA: CRISPR-associated protein Cas5 [Actinomycetes bacterium]|nr:CRISPR-associated protein Cas5 [Actinomycetes bacterium]
MTTDAIALTGGPAVRARLLAPVASFRDPMFPGLQAGLLVPPPATVRGLLAAAWGSYERLGRVHVGIAFRIGGEAMDLETYHPLNTDGRMRFPGVDKGPTPLERHLVVDAELTVWAIHDNPEACAAALRRPVWALHLGRSQDLVHLVDIDVVELRTVDRGRQGFALVPVGAVPRGTGDEYRLATWVAADRRRTRYEDFLWAEEGGGDVETVVGALVDEGGQLVWPIDVNDVDEVDSAA